jgi:hypothetical protein
MTWTLPLGGTAGAVDAGTSENIPSNFMEIPLPPTLELCSDAAGFVIFLIGLVSLVTVAGGIAAG